MKAYESNGKSVALRKESVDRNSADVVSVQHGCVALRKESVDRNICWMSTTPSRAPVALRKESVDRNICMKEVLPWVLPSLSARRAWIEMSMGLDGRFKLWSLSARRAWIEILVG